MPAQNPNPLNPATMPPNPASQAAKKSAELHQACLIEIEIQKFNAQIRRLRKEMDENIDDQQTFASLQGQRKSLEKEITDLRKVHKARRYQSHEPSDWRVLRLFGVKKSIGPNPNDTYRSDCEGSTRLFHKDNNGKTIAGSFFDLSDNPDIVVSQLRDHKEDWDTMAKEVSPGKTLTLKGDNSAAVYYLSAFMRGKHGRTVDPKSEGISHWVDKPHWFTLESSKKKYVEGNIRGLVSCCQDMYQEIMNSDKLSDAAKKQFQTKLDQQFGCTPGQDCKTYMDACLNPEALKSHSLEEMQQTFKTIDKDDTMQIFHDMYKKMDLDVSMEAEMAPQALSMSMGG